MEIKVNLIGLQGELVKEGVILPDPINQPQFITYQNRWFSADFNYGDSLKIYSEVSDVFAAKD